MRDPLLIVGGGAAGIAAAVALARRGLPSLVFERSGSPLDIDRGDIIHAGSRVLLERWNAWEFLKKRDPKSFSRFRILDGDGRRLLGVEVEAALGGSRRLTALRHPDIVLGLRDAAMAGGLVTMHLGEPVQDLCSSGGRIVGVRTARGEYRSPLTVIATGTKSALRDAHFGPADIREYGTSFYNARVAALDAYEGCGYYVLDKEGVLVLVSLPRNELRIGIQFRTSDRNRRPTRASFADHATRILRPLRNETLTLIEGRTYRLRGLLADRWAIPGAVLLGDTAHSVHPTGGQGMNLAFQDAEALARCIEGQHSLTALDEACAKYAFERRSQVRRVISRTNVGAVLAGFSHPAPVLARRLALQALDHAVPLKQALIRQLVDAPQGADKT
ncbi:FAD-dependent oxidoreductase [Streptomyces sp. NPDC017529]|uniref:FAD-dependent oxidoreductase n=1 Tax=Streptomyces sp. NPDC017529 TaxID=3365000 RepID=UPI003799EB03